MKTIKYKTSSPLIDIPEDIITDKDKDFFVSLFNRLKHDRNNVDPDCLYKAYLCYHDYEPTYKMYNIEKACIQYAVFTNNKRVLIKLQKHLKRLEKMINESKKYLYS